MTPPMWFRTPKADAVVEAARSIAHTPKPRLIQPGSVEMSGMQLENTVARRVMEDINWQLEDMQMLLVRLHVLGFYVDLYNLGVKGWVCTVAKEENADDWIEEYANEAPAIALARAALAAIVQWPV